MLQFLFNVEKKITFLLIIASDNWCFSRAVGYRFGPHLGDTVPVLINYCNKATENDEELCEYSLQVISLFYEVCIFVNVITQCQ